MVRRLSREAAAACGLACEHSWIPPRRPQGLHIRRIGRMSLMQRPAIVRLHKRPRLSRQSNLDRIVLNVRNRAIDLIWMIKKYFPPAACRPHRMIARPQSMDGIDQRPSCCILKQLDHLFRTVLVLANENMHVIRHDRAGVARVPLFGYHTCKCRGDNFDRAIPNL